MTTPISAGQSYKITKWSGLLFQGYKQSMSLGGYRSKFNTASPLTYISGKSARPAVLNNATFYRGGLTFTESDGMTRFNEYLSAASKENLEPVKDLLMPLVKKIDERLSLAESTLHSFTRSKFKNLAISLFALPAVHLTLTAAMLASPAFLIISPALLLCEELILMVPGLLINFSISAYKARVAQKHAQQASILMKEVLSVLERSGLKEEAKAHAIAETLEGVLLRSYQTAAFLESEVGATLFQEQDTQIDAQGIFDACLSGLKQKLTGLRLDQENKDQEVEAAELRAGELHEEMLHLKEALKLEKIPSRDQRSIGKQLEALAREARVFYLEHLNLVVNWGYYEYGKDHPDSDEAFRAYIQIPHRLIPEALKILREVAEKREEAGGSTGMKFCLSQNKQWDENGDDLPGNEVYYANYGSYDRYKHGDPVICLYFPSATEILETLAMITANPAWQKFEDANRTDPTTAGHRRKGTSAYISGQEWRSINLNYRMDEQGRRVPRAGYSEKLYREYEKTYRAAMKEIENGTPAHKTPTVQLWSSQPEVAGSPTIALGIDAGLSWDGSERIDIREEFPEILTGDLIGRANQIIHVELPGANLLIDQLTSERMRISQNVQRLSGTLKILQALSDEGVGERINLGDFSFGTLARRKNEKLMQLHTALILLRDYYSEQGSNETPRLRRVQDLLGRLEKETKVVEIIRQEKLDQAAKKIVKTLEGLFPVSLAHFYFQNAKYAAERKYRDFRDLAHDFMHSPLNLLNYEALLLSELPKDLPSAEREALVTSILLWHSAIEKTSIPLPGTGWGAFDGTYSFSHVTPENFKEEYGVFFLYSGMILAGRAVPLSAPRDERFRKYHSDRVIIDNNPSGPHSARLKNFRLRAKLDSAGFYNSSIDEKVSILNRFFNDYLATTKRYNPRIAEELSAMFEAGSEFLSPAVRLGGGKGYDKDDAQASAYCRNLIGEYVSAVQEIGAEVQYNQGDLLRFNPKTYGLPESIHGARNEMLEWYFNKLLKNEKTPIPSGRDAHLDPHAWAVFPSLGLLQDPALRQSHDFFHSDFYHGGMIHGAETIKKEGRVFYVYTIADQRGENISLYIVEQDKENLVWKPKV